MNEQAMDTVTLLLDNDESVECAILCILPVQGKDYIALLPDRKSTRLNSSHMSESRMPSSA